MKPQVIIILVLAAVLGLILFVLYEIWENHRLITEHYRVVKKKLPDVFNGFRFVFLTDLHNNRFGEGNKKLLRAIEQADPQLILIGGDMIVGKQPEKDPETKAFLKILAEKYPVYYVNGNHEGNRRNASEQGLQSMEAYEEELKASGIRFLHNETVYLKKNGARIALTGSEPEQRYYKRGRIEPMADEVLHLAVKKPDAFTILLAHTPFYFENYVSWGADLVLSGHVHGGMIRLPFLGGVASPQYTLFPKYDSGIYTKNDTTMLLSRGLGLHTIPIRVWNRPELSVIELVSEEKNAAEPVSGEKTHETGFRSNAEKMAGKGKKTF